MKLVIRHQFRDLGNFYVTSFFNKLYQKLQDKYSLYDFDIINDLSYENKGYGGIYSCMNFSIINPDNEKYIVISFFDNWRYLFMKHLGWNPQLMTQMFYCGGFNFLEYFYWRNYELHNDDVYLPLDIQNKYCSFFYNPYNTNHINDEQFIYQNYDINNAIPKLYFRGYMWDFRKDMVQHISQDDILIIDKNIDTNNLDYIEYLQDLTKYRAALSLPGGTEICNRDMECFSVGIPVIRPLLTTTYPEPLIPNYHYISCYDNAKYWDGNPSYNSYKDFSESLVDCWNKIKSNIEYLSFISNNAHNWYMKNCNIEYNIDYVLSKLNIESLYD